MNYRRQGRRSPLPNATDEHPSARRRPHSRRGSRDMEKRHDHRSTDDPSDAGTQNPRDSASLSNLAAEINALCEHCSTLKTMLSDLKTSSTLPLPPPVPIPPERVLQQGYDARTPWDAFISGFEQLAGRSGWSPAQKADFLLGALKGEARDVISLIDPRTSSDYNALRGFLTDVFGPVHRASPWSWSSTSPLPGESPFEFSRRKNRLSRMPGWAPANSYDGRSPWETFISSFDELAERSDWTPAQKTDYLLNALEGDARNVLGHIDPRTFKDYNSLRSVLGDHFDHVRPWENRAGRQFFGDSGGLWASRGLLPDETADEYARRMHRLALLPEWNVPHLFDGRSNWDTFINAFEQLADRSAWSPAEKADYLLGALEGDARHALNRVDPRVFGDYNRLRNTLGDFFNTPRRPGDPLRTWDDRGAHRTETTFEQGRDGRSAWSTSTHEHHSDNSDNRRWRPDDPRFDDYTGRTRSNRDVTTNVVTEHFTNRPRQNQQDAARNVNDLSKLLADHGLPSNLTGAGNVPSDRKGPLPGHGLPLDYRPSLGHGLLPGGSAPHGDLPAELLDQLAALQGISTSGLSEVRTHYRVHVPKERKQDRSPNHHCCAHNTVTCCSSLPPCPCSQEECWAKYRVLSARYK